MSNASNRWGKYADVPRNVGIGFGCPGYNAGRWEIYRRLWRDEAGILEMNFIVRTPFATPLHPDTSQVMQIFGSVCDHVERVPEFVSTSAGWCYWIVGLTTKKSTVQPLLLGPRAQCGCDSWLNSGTSREVYQLLRKWLEWRNQVGD